MGDIRANIVSLQVGLDNTDTGSTVAPPPPPAMAGVAAAAMTGEDHSPRGQATLDMLNRLVDVLEQREMRSSLFAAKAIEELRAAQERNRALEARLKDMETEGAELEKQLAMALNDRRTSDIWLDRLYADIKARLTDKSWDRHGQQNQAA